MSNYCDCHINIDCEWCRITEQNKRYREHLEYMLAEAKDHKEKGLRIQHWALIKDLEKALEESQ